MRMSAAVVAAIWVLVPASHAGAQPPPPTPPCATADHQAFDFWLGAWRVTTPDGKVAGENEIQKVANGCALLENWVGADGGTGKSLNYFDPVDDRWHQTWVGAGTILDLSGSFADGAMSLQGTRPGPDGKPRVHRIRWSPAADGSVRQHWEVSADGGATWTTAFDGKYTRK